MVECGGEEVLDERQACARARAVDAVSHDRLERPGQDLPEERVQEPPQVRRADGRVVGRRQHRRERDNDVRPPVDGGPGARRMRHEVPHHGVAVRGELEASIEQRIDDGVHRRLENAADLPQRIRDREDSREPCRDLLAVGEEVVAGDGASVYSAASRERVVVPSFDIRVEEPHLVAARRERLRERKEGADVTLGAPGL